MTFDDQMRANMAALGTVLMALVETHPNRLALAAKLRALAVKHDVMMLDSTTPDEVIALASQQILAYATMASPA
jgi:hypothetical protein